tara:strand:+ start:5801 stop:6775 length:975 start_codon:yes stop_codon:yes gene_type:complete
MGQLVDGKWLGGDHRQIGASGWEPRQEHLKGYVKAAPAESGAEFQAEAGRYHLIECPGCPMAQRVAILHRLKGLKQVISTSRVRPIMGPNGREFGTRDQAAKDDATGFRYLYELYLATSPAYTGRASTPVLWDKQQHKIVSNAYSDIFGMINAEFDAFTDVDLDLRPADLAPALSEMLAYLGAGFVAAVYRCGFAREQSVYDDNIARIAKTVPELNRLLEDQPFLLGDRMTEADLVLFTSLIRFDAIYIPLFQCSAVRIEDFPALTGFIERIFALPGVAETFDLEDAMVHYYGSHAHINPTRIVPVPPRLSWLPAAGGLRAAAA